MRMGILSVDSQHLANILGFEGGYVDATAFNYERNCFEFRVVHADCPEISMGMHVGHLNPAFRRVSCGHQCDLGEHKEVYREGS